MFKSQLIIASIILLTGCGGSSSNSALQTSATASTADEVTQRVVQQEENIKNSSAWSFDTGAPIYATAAVNSDQVFIANEEGAIYALTQDKGSVVWQRNIDARITGDIVHYDNKIIFLTESAELIALNTLDGSDEWIHKTPSERVTDTWDYHNNHPLIIDDQLYLLSKGGYVYSISPATGELIWQKYIGERLLGRPALYNNTLSFASENGLYNLDLNTLEINWFNTSSGYSASPAAANGVVITGSRYALVQAIDFTTGEDAWTVQHGGNWVTGEAIYHEGDFYVGTSDDHLLESINAMTGKVNWHIDAGSNVFARPVIYKDKVIITSGSAYVYKSKGYLTVVNLSGEVQWQIEATNFLSTASASQNHIYIGNESGHFYALPIEQ